jgi:hypothetical protein
MNIPPIHPPTLRSQRALGRVAHLLAQEVGGVSPEGSFVLAFPFAPFSCFSVRSLAWLRSAPERVGTRQIHVGEEVSVGQLLCFMQV